MFAVDLVAALSAIAGGAAVTAGWIPFPAEWLDGSPFTDYTVPGLVLCLVVGGSAAVAAIATLRGARVAPAASAIAGAVMMGWIVGEVVILGPKAYTWLQPASFAVGLAMAILAMLSRRSGVASLSRLRRDAVSRGPVRRAP